MNATTTARPAPRPADRATPGAPGRPAIALRGALAGTGSLVRLALRRDRVLLPVQVVVVALLLVSTVAAVTDVYGTQASRDRLSATMGVDAAFLALLGPYENTGSVASTSWWRVGVFLLVVVAVLAVLAVVRHTRAEEEAGRLELVRAARVGVLAPLATGLTVAALLSLGSGAATTALLAGRGPLDGAVVAGLQQLALGLAAAGLAAVCAQLATAARTASSIGVLVLVAGYALRGVADVDPDAVGWLRWTTPVGWAQAVDPYGADDLRPALLCAALGVVGAVVGAWLALHRDLGAGMVQPRPGPGEGPRLRTAGSLVVRLTGTSVAAWASGVGFYCLLVGFLVTSADDLVADNPQMEQLLTQLGGAGALADVFQSVVLSFVAIAAAAYGVSLAQRVRGEEAAGRTEAVLATAVGRARYAGTWVTASVVGTVVVLLVGGLLMGVGHGVSTGAWGDALGAAVGGAVARVPSALVVSALAAALWAWWPRLVALGWAVLVGTFLVDLLGGMLDLPAWVTDLSPFTHAPAVPQEAWSDVDLAPLAWLVVVAVALYGATVAGLRRRDVPAV